MWRGQATEAYRPQAGYEEELRNNEVDGRARLTSCIYPRASDGRVAPALDSSGQNLEEGCDLSCDGAGREDGEERNEEAAGPAVAPVLAGVRNAQAERHALTIATQSAGSAHLVVHQEERTTHEEEGAPGHSAQEHADEREPRAPKGDGVVEHCLLCQDARRCICHASYEQREQPDACFPRVPEGVSRKTSSVGDLHSLNGGSSSSESAGRRACRALARGQGQAPNVEACISATGRSKGAPRPVSPFLRGTARKYNTAAHERVYHPKTRSLTLPSTLFCPACCCCCASTACLLFSANRLACASPVLPPGVLGAPPSPRNPLRVGVGAALNAACGPSTCTGLPTPDGVDAAPPMGAECGRGAGVLVPEGTTSCPLSPPASARLSPSSSTALTPIMSTPPRISPFFRAARAADHGCAYTTVTQLPPSVDGVDETTSPNWAKWSRMSSRAEAGKPKMLTA